MPGEEVSKNAGTRRLRTLAGVIIDIALLSFVIYVGWVIGLGTLTFVEGIVRHDLLGYRASADLAEIRRQTISAPLISGRPVFFHVIITYIAPAITVLLYLHLLKLTSNRSTPGTILAHRGLSKTLSSKRKVRWTNIGAEARAFAHRELESAISDRLGFKDWQEVFEGLRKALGNARDLAAPIIRLPRAARWVAWVSLSAVLILSAAGPILYAYDSKLAHFNFADVNNRAASVQVLAFYLSLGGIVLGWAVVLVSASITNTVLLLITGVFYIFTFVFIGIGGGRSWWLPLPEWMVLLLAATTPVARHRVRWLRFVGIWMLAAIAIFHSLRLTPLPRLALSRAWIAAVLLALLLAALLRRRTRLPVSILFPVALVVNAVFVALVLRAGAETMAGGLYYSVYQLISVLTLFWFLLGGSYVDACITLTRESVSKISQFFTPRLYPSLLIVICLAELFILGELSMLRPSFMYQSAMNQSTLPILSIAGHQLSISRESWLRIFSLPGHQGVVLILLLGAAMLAASGRYTPGAAKALGTVWAFSLFLIWAFFLQMVPVLSTEPKQPTDMKKTVDIISEALEHNNQILTMTLLSVAVVWAAFSGASRLARDGKQPRGTTGLRLFSFGGLTLLASLSLFVFSSQTVNPTTASAYMYSGLDSLWIPMTAYAVLAALYGFGGKARASILASFLLGAVISGAVLVQRTVIGNPGAGLWLYNLAIVAWGELAIVIASFGLARLQRVTDVIHASTVGLACAFGFAVSHTENLVLPLVGQWLNAFAALTAFRALHRIAGHLYEPSNASLIPLADGVFFYVLAPASAGIIGVLSCRGRETGHRFSIALIAVAVAALATIYAIPLYKSDLGSMPLSFTPSLSISTVGLVRSNLPILTYILIPAIAASWYLLRFTFRSSHAAASRRLMHPDLSVIEPQVR